MDGAVISAAIWPLVGVVLGTAGTLVGQFIATRGESRRQAEQRAAEIRAERKEAIISFLDAVQPIDQIVDDRVHGRSSADAPLGDLLHAMWLAKKVLELVCGFDLASVSHRYASTLDTLARASSIEGPSAKQKEYRGEFMEAARRELGIEGARLYGR